MSAPLKTEIISETLEASQTIFIGFVAFTILIWDHAVTFADEVKIIWGGPKNFLACYFLLIRYLTPISFIVNIVAYTLPSWSSIHFVRYEGAMSAILSLIVALMMFLRVRAIYHNNGYAVGLLASLLFAWVSVGAWLLSHGEAVPYYSSYIHPCRMEFSASVGDFASAWAWIPLLYDTVVFALTLNRTLPSIRNKEAGHVARTLFADGVLFYCVMCAINLTFTIMIVRAPHGLKNITGQLELILTVTMMSRITLSLKKEGLRGPSLNRHSESRFPVSFGLQKSGEPHPLVLSSSQKDSEVLPCSQVVGAFEHADDE